MTWLTAVPDAPSPFESVLGHRPELLALYKEFYGRLWDEALLPAALLELCRLRIAALHGCEAERAVRHAQADLSAARLAALDEWTEADLFTPAERAALTIAEKLVWAHHDITDADVAEAKRHLGPAGVVALLTAVSLFDATCRLRLAFDLPAVAATVDAPCSAHGTLR